MKADGFEPDMPETEASYILGYLFDIGPVISGPSPITSQELLAWQSNTGIDLQPWESELLRRLSREYLAEHHKAEKPDCPAPWQPADHSQETRDAISKKVKNSMRSLMMAQENMK